MTFLKFIARVFLFIFYYPFLEMRWYSPDVYEREDGGRLRIVIWLATWILGCNILLAYLLNVSSKEAFQLVIVSVEEADWSLFIPLIGISLGYMFLYLSLCFFVDIRPFSTKNSWTEEREQEKWKKWKMGQLVREMKQKQK